MKWSPSPTRSSVSISASDSSFRKTQSSKNSGVGIDGPSLEPSAGGGVARVCGPRRVRKTFQKYRSHSTPVTSNRPGQAQQSETVQNNHSSLRSSDSTPEQQERSAVLVRALDGERRRYLPPPRAEDVPEAAVLVYRLTRHHAGRDVEVVR